MTDTASFYGAAAGAIPLLYIALAVEERSGTAIDDLVDLLVEDEATRPIAATVLRGVYLFVVAAVLLTGVAAAFVGLAHPEARLVFASGYTAWFVAVALGFGGILLTIQPFLGIVLGLLKRQGASRAFSLHALVVALVFALLVVYLVWGVAWALVH